eukprot:Clim_evm80s201 gene=Clim_evmTU80s201
MKVIFMLIATLLVAMASVANGETQYAPTYSRYHRLAELGEEMDKILRDSPDLVRVAGAYKSRAGRPVPVVELSDPFERLNSPISEKRSMAGTLMDLAMPRAKPKVVIFGGLHGHEFMTSELVFTALTRPLETIKHRGQEAQRYGHSILSTLQLYFIPVVDPDIRHDVEVAHGDMCQNKAAMWDPAGRADVSPIETILRDLQPDFVVFLQSGYEGIGRHSGDPVTKHVVDRVGALTDYYIKGGPTGLEPAGQKQLDDAIDPIVAALKRNSPNSRYIFLGTWMNLEHRGNEHCFSAYNPTDQLLSNVVSAAYPALDAVYSSMMHEAFVRNCARHYQPLVLFIFAVLFVALVVFSQNGQAFMRGRSRARSTTPSSPLPLLSKKDRY